MTTTPTLAEVLSMSTRGALAGVRVAMPGRVVSYDKTKQKADVQPLVMDGFENEDGDREVEAPPILNDVPVVFPGAGAFRLIFPVKPGAQVLHVACSSSIARWKVTGGGPVDPGDDRRHALADCVAIPGIFDFAHVPTSNPQDDHLELVSSGEIRAGGTNPLVTKAEFDGHTHLPGTFTAGATPVTGTSAGAVAVTGTAKLRG